MRIEAKRHVATAARQQAILDGALACFAELGVEGTTIDDIRRRADASVGSIYHHFGSKEGVAAALYLHGIQRYQAGLGAAVEKARDARSAVRAIVLFHLDWATKNVELARYLLQMRRAEATASVDQDVRDANRDVFERLSKRLEKFVAKGDIAELPRELYAPLIIGPTQEVVRAWLNGRIATDPRKLRDTLAEAAWQSVQPSRPAP